MDIVKTFEKVNGVPVKYKIVDRRPGDVAICYADPEKAYNDLDWKAELGLEEMCKDSWHYAKTGFKNSPDHEK